MFFSLFVPPFRMTCRSVCLTTTPWNEYICLRPTLTTSDALLSIQRSPTFSPAVVCLEKQWHHDYLNVPCWISSSHNLSILVLEFSYKCVFKPYGHDIWHMDSSLTDDMLIKLWDWDKKWSCSQVFEGHTHYVMQIVINPKDNNQFASASLDRTIKVEWSWCC